jgi:hypothetical protein
MTTATATGTPADRKRRDAAEEHLRTPEMAKVMDAFRAALRSLRDAETHLDALADLMDHTAYQYALIAYWRSSRASLRGHDDDDDDDSVQDCTSLRYDCGHAAYMTNLLRTILESVAPPACYPDRDELRDDEPRPVIVVQKGGRS